jgi:CheY-like chemotaxis protein
MPQLSGYELCAMLKQTHQLAHTPIIMVTSNEGYLDRSQARLSGSSGYLTKPVTSKELLAIIAKHLNRA